MKTIKLTIFSVLLITAGVLLSEMWPRLQARDPLQGRLPLSSLTEKFKFVQIEFSDVGKRCYPRKEASIEKLMSKLEEVFGVPYICHAEHQTDEWAFMVCRNSYNGEYATYEFFTTLQGCWGDREYLGLDK